MSEHDRQLQRHYTAEELVAVTGVSRTRLAAWIRCGLITPVGECHSLPVFDFVQVSSARRLVQLTRAGISTRHIRRSLERLRQWFPEMVTPLLQLQTIERHGALAFRTQSGHLSDPGGQFHLDFSAAGEPSLPKKILRSADQWFKRGCELEGRGQLSTAAKAFRQALLIGGPDVDTIFNLANVLFAQGYRREAAERYRQAIEMEPALADAWNNLGVALAALSRIDEALATFRRAIQLDSNYADAHFNLANCLEKAGYDDEARPHWQSYITLDTQSADADYARERLAR